MKKFLYIIISALILSSSLISCTEENVAPKTNTDNSFGNVSDPKGN